jgi:hypothetical protein
MRFAVRSASTNSKAEPATKSAVKPQAKAAANGSSSDDADDGLAE